ncbi:host attachment protein [Legionella longbeachae]|uniref:Protein required for attachment to host cells n=1 Tax=Legionella longbeachae serogroup 1 (strain NSW150) TaxID=661367 RepID=D3HSY8_LEGLN|nr:host attachment protein [Legionella longbeachae]VEE02519.1 Protein required for attachment to host cells [Legionella oakridgensis]HBD7398779.1 host attachment protein [Legionella pneumophila]ARB91209.1 host attachment protein [Legionella longbeachae]ARM32366.1 host attachment protein [Legionella longbeachae]EEZ94841.1 conserved hypothetical protein [Legionella longbeachae D-4968]
MSFDQHTWVVTADTTTCRIYASKVKHHDLTLVKEMVHPQSKLKDIELTSGKAGHTEHGTYTQQSDPKEIEIDSFARTIADALDDGRNMHAYEKLIVVAPPHMNGLLLHHTNKHVTNLVIHNFKSDVMHFSNKELYDFLDKNLRPH